MERSIRSRFGRKNRLADEAAFGRVFKKAFRSRDNWFTVLCRRNDLELARLGLAISKKNCRKAAARNRLKRIVRESFREHQEELGGLDVVVMNKAAAAEAKNEALFESLVEHWRNCGQARNGDE